MSLTLYYTVSANDLRANMPAQAVLLSAASFYRPRKTMANPLRMPKALAQARTSVTLRGADCGAFTATMHWGGSYRFSDLDSIAWLYQWLPHWAATKDLCCLSPTRDDPGRAVIQERQDFTTMMAERFWDCYHDVPWAWCPTITGFSITDFEQHARRLTPLIREMMAYYSDPGRWTEEEEEYEQQCTAFRVGVGNLCGRSPKFVLEVVSCIESIIGIDVPLHLWATKLKTLQAGKALPDVVSCDTGAWNGLWGKAHEKRRKSKLTETEYSWHVAYPAYNQKIQQALQKPQQTSLFTEMLAFPSWPLIPPDSFMDDIPPEQENTEKEAEACFG
jgi:hypothetical protein